MNRLLHATLASAALLLASAPLTAAAADGPPKPGKCSLVAGVGAADAGGSLAAVIGLALVTGAITARRRRS